MTGLIALVVIVAVVALVSASGVKVVPQSRVGIVERLGRYHRTAESGLTFIVPVIDRMLPGTDLLEQELSFQSEPVITSDNLVLQVSAIACYRVVDARAAEYEVENLTDALEQVARTILRNIIGDFTLDRALASKDEIGAKLRTVLDDVSEKWGTRTTQVEIKDITPPSENLADEDAGRA